MKIVNRATFLSMPPGTVFAKYEPCIFGELEIKHDTLPTDDFWSQQVVGSLDAAGDRERFMMLEDAKTNGASIPMDFDCLSRDGCFDDNQLFAVFEPADVAQLIDRLQQALKESQA